MNSHGFRKWSVKLPIYTILTFYSALILFPLYLMFVTSLKNNRQIFTTPFGLPSPPDPSG